jgi:hypothetical protein
MALTTPVKVRQRLSIDEYQAPDTLIDDFIASADGEIHYRLGRTPVSGDDDFTFACAISTGLAAYTTGMHIPYPENKDEAYAWMQKLKLIRGKTSSDLVYLCDDLYPTVALAKSTTEDS